THPLLGWVNMPNAETRVVTAGRDVLVRFNSAGLRGPEVALAKPAGTRRILLLGDGFTEGYTVPEESTVRTGLESRLRAAGCQVEVINGGVAGYATDQEYLLYTSTLRRYEPDLVVILLYSDDLAQVLQGPGSKPAVDFDEGLQVRPPTTLQRERLRTRELQYVDRSRRDHSAFLRLVSNALLAAGPVLRRASVSLGLAEKGRPPSEILPY